MKGFMEFIRKNILYRNLPPASDTSVSDEVHQIKTEMAREALKTHLKVVEVNKALDKSQTYFIAHGMRVIGKEKK